jgi:hypothetical protein
MKWNISVIRGKNTKKYFVSTGEGLRKNKLIFRPKNINKNKKYHSR